jgi:thioredoxin reductase
MRPSAVRHNSVLRPFDKARRSVGRDLAFGDVRSSSIKRVASAVGEGSMAARLIHQRLASLQTVLDESNSD